jgi:adenosylhomocysteine nucleosidase
MQEKGYNNPMIYIITALDAEARPLVENYRLKRDRSLPYTLYRNEEVVLLVCGVGKANAMMGVSALLGWRIPDAEDILINIGICGAPLDYPIGEALLIHQIFDGDRHYYPDILYPHTLRETSMKCVDAPQSTLSDYPIDMESSAIFQSAERFFKLHQMAYLKIVSDHCTPESVTKEGAMALLHSHLKTLDSLISNLQAIQNYPLLFSSEERDAIDTFKGHFTKSQSDALEDALNYFRLKNKTQPLSLNLPIPNFKRERSQLLDELIATLTA